MNVFPTFNCLLQITEDFLYNKGKIATLANPDFNYLVLLQWGHIITDYEVSSSPVAHTCGIVTRQFTGMGAGSLISTHLSRQPGALPITEHFQVAARAHMCVGAHK